MTSSSVYLDLSPDVAKLGTACRGRRRTLGPPRRVAASSPIGDLGAVLLTGPSGVLNLSFCLPIEVAGKLRLLFMRIMWEAGTTMINANRLGKLDELHRAGTRRDAEFVVEEARLLDELLASADLGSSTTREVRLGNQLGAQTSVAETPQLEVTGQAPAPVPDQAEEPAMTVPQSAYGAPTSAGPALTDITSIGEADVLGELDELRRAWAPRDADTPHLPEKSRPRLGVRTSVVGVLALVLLIATLGTGFIALKQNTAAGQWRRHDHSEMRVNARSRQTWHRLTRPSHRSTPRQQN